MEPNNYNSVHILSEAVIMGGISMYFYKKISELEATIEDLKSQIMMQNNQIRYLLTGGQIPGSNSPQISPQNTRQQSVRNTTPLKMPILKQKENFLNGFGNHKTDLSQNYALEQQQRAPIKFNDQLPPSSIQEISNTSSYGQSEPSNIHCEGGVCKLVPHNPTDTLTVGPIDTRTKFPDMANSNHKLDQPEKKVVISKISKQIEFDRENMELDQASKVNTFTNFSPNPVLKSVTPRPSISESGDGTTDLENILNDIDDE